MEADFSYARQRTQFYLAPGDDQHLTLDFNDFDKSVAYSGRGANAGNYVAQALYRYAYNAPGQVPAPESQELGATKARDMAMRQFPFWMLDTDVPGVAACLPTFRAHEPDSAIGRTLRIALARPGLHAARQRGPAGISERLSGQGGVPRLLGYLVRPLHEGDDRVRAGPQKAF